MGSPGGEPLRIALLGPVLAWRGDRELALGPAQRQAVLAMLALRAGRVVSRDELVDGVWGADPPPSVVNGVHVLIGALRRVLEPGRARRAPCTALVSVGSGYRLVLAPGQLDVEVFDGELRRARDYLTDGTPALARQAFDTALALWRGTPLATVPGPFAEAERARLVEVWLAALEQRAEALIGCGDLAAATAELGALVAAHPLRERLRELLMTTLYRTGRQADALAAFADARQLLDRELGIEPGPALRRLHLDILRGNQLEAGTARHTPPGPGTPTSSVKVVPRQLPPAVRHFTGRTAERKMLAGLLGAGHGRPGAVPIAAVHGTAGVGKPNPGFGHTYLFEGLEGAA